MKKKQENFRYKELRTLVVCAFPYASLKAFIPLGFVPSETHFSTGYE